MGGILNADQHKALSLAPCYGSSAGSNMWPLVYIHNGDGSEKVDGEIFDGLLRDGYLSAAPLPEPILTDRSDDHDIAPDCEVTHDIKLTDKGLRAMKQGRPVAA